MRGGREAHTWHAGRGSGQGRAGGWTCRTGARLRVEKGHHVVRGVHFQTPFLLCSRARGPTLCLCLCFRPAARLATAKLSSLSLCLCAL